MVMLSLNNQGDGWSGWTPPGIDLPWGGPGEPRRPWSNVRIDWSTPRSQERQATQQQAPWWEGRPTANQFARTASGMPRSPDAASVWAQGGVSGVRAAQDSALWDPNNENSLFGMMGTKQYVGIENNAEWINGGWLPQLGYDAKAGPYGNPYQLPEYLVSDVGSTLQSMTDEELSKFRQRAIAAGLWNPDVFPSAYGVTEEDMRIMSSLMSQANWSKATSWDALLYELEQNPNADLGEGGSGSGSGGFEPSTTTQKVYSKTSVEAGRSYLRAYMAELLGRAPTDSEVSRYVASLNRVENRRPQITETTRTMGDNENDIISTTRTLGNAPEPTEFLRREVEEGNTAEKNTFQAQNYFDRLMSVI